MAAEDAAARADFNGATSASVALKGSSLRPAMQLASHLAADGNQKG